MARANLPAIKVYIAHDDGPLVASPSWTDESAYFRGRGDLACQILRGNDPEDLDGQTSPGTLSLVLDDRTRRFDPTYAAGALYGKLLPRRQIKIEAVWASVTYPMFRGHIQGWPQEYVYRKDALVRIQAVDMLQYLSELSLSDPVLAYMVSLGATNFYRQADNTTWVDAIAGTNAQLTGGTGEVGTSSLAPGLASTPVLYNNANWGHADILGSGNDLAVSFWLKTTITGGSTSAWRSIVGRDGSSAFLMRIGIDSTGVIKYEGYDFTPAGYRPTATSTKVVTDGQTHHVVVTQSGSAPYTIKIYVDGVDATGASVLTAGKLEAQWIGAAMGTSPGDYNYVGELQDVAYFSAYLTAAQVRSIYQMGYNQYQESTATRAQSVLTAASVPAGLVSISATTRGQCLDNYDAGQAALEALLQVDATEQGRLFVSKDGKVTFHDRYYRQEQTRGNTVQHTFSDDGSDSPYMGYQSDFDLRDVQNDITVTVSGGGRANASDTTSKTTFGQRSGQVSTLLPSVIDGAQMAAGLVYQRKDILTRSRPIQVPPGRLTTVWPGVLGLELGDRIQHEITPMGLGAQTVQVQSLEQIGWTITAGHWVLTVGGSPIPADFTLWDVSGTWDGTGRWGY